MVFSFLKNVTVRVMSKERMNSKRGVTLGGGERCHAGVSGGETGVLTEEKL